jgi:hypothetical protein
MASYLYCTGEEQVNIYRPMVRINGERILPTLMDRMDCNDIVCV